MATNRILFMRSKSTMTLTTNDENRLQNGFDGARTACIQTAKRKFMEISNKCDLVPVRAPKMLTRAVNRAIARVTLASTPIDLDASHRHNDQSIAVASSGHHNHWALSMARTEMNSCPSLRKCFQTQTVAPVKRETSTPLIVISPSIATETKAYTASFYVTETLCFLRQRENQFQIENYLEKHQMTESNRTAIINWIQRMEAETVSPSIEKIYLAVKIFDLFLCRTKNCIPKMKLQLIGMTSLLLAYKFDGFRSDTNFRDFHHLYTRDELIKIERIILNELHFELAIPLAIDFLHGYSKLGQMSNDVVAFAEIILRLTLNDLNVAFVRESYKAAASLWISARMCTNQCSDNRIVNHYSAFMLTEFKNILIEINRIVHLHSETFNCRENIKLCNECDLFAGTQFAGDLKMSCV